MKQVTQRLKDGQIDVMDLPAPVLLPYGVIVDVRASLLSAGTERSTVEAARQGLIGKARARPEQARQVLLKARQDGIRATLDSVRSRLNQPSGLGYSTAGIVIAVGQRVRGLAPGDRVACGGGGYASHAELNYVPGNLCVPLPEAVSFEEGAFATLGSIAMQGVRQSGAVLGERVAVIGLGLVGQLACRLLLASGCDVVGIDLMDELVERARAAGASAAFLRSELDAANLPPAAQDCDAVIVTAATRSDDPARLAGALARDRGRVVIVGDVGMTLPRSSYYGKELELRLSRSYGPGRYDREYEERGLDYPIGYVRWTERRNMEAFVALLEKRRLSVEDLITARMPIEKAAEAYERLVSNGSSPLGLVLTYGESPRRALEVVTPNPAKRPTTGRRAGVIGAGSFSQRVLMPALRDAGFSLEAVASATGLSARAAAERFAFSTVTTPDDLLAADDVDVVVVASRHDSHAEYAMRGLASGKPVFVEKPPALSFDELNGLRKAAAHGLLWVGFNRRFAPLAIAMREYIAPADRPVELLYRVAAGRLPADHWLNDADDGGGRLLGEGCHFVDFACWFMGGLPADVQATVYNPGGPLMLAQRFAINLTFANGSLATILYGSESAPGVNKELVEAHCDRRSARLDDFRRLQLLGSKSEDIRSRVTDKGHRAQFEAFRRAVEGDGQPVPDMLETMGVTLWALRAATGDP
jgi:polar amino acid transport system substrate-binding protein